MSKYLNFMKTYRQYKGIKQRKLAEQLDVDQSIISSWETGRAIPPIEIREKVSEILGVDIQKVFP